MCDLDPALLQPSAMTLDVRRCARCHGDHPGLVFSLLRNPPQEFGYYATCPTSGQPILLAVTHE